MLEKLKQNWLHIFVVVFIIIDLILIGCIIRYARPSDEDTMSLRDNISIPVEKDEALDVNMHEYDIDMDGVESKDE